jgi:hypothetical protein
MGIWRGSGVAGRRFFAPPRPARLCGLHNVKPIGVQKKGVVPEQFAQLWNCRMVVRKGLCFELIQGTFDYCRCQFHHEFLLIELAQYGKIKAPSRVLREPCHLGVICRSRKQLLRRYKRLGAIGCASVMRLVDAISHLYWPE